MNSVIILRLTASAPDRRSSPRSLDGLKPTIVGPLRWFLKFLEIQWMLHIFLFVLENARHYFGCSRSGWRFPSADERVPPEKVRKVSKEAIKYDTPLVGYELVKTWIMTLTGVAAFRLVSFALTLFMGVVMLNIAAVVPDSRWRNFWLYGPIRVTCFVLMSFLGYYRIDIRRKGCLERGVQTSRTESYRCRRNFRALRHRLSLLRVRSRQHSPAAVRCDLQRLRCDFGRSVESGFAEGYAESDKAARGRSDGVAADGFPRRNDREPGSPLSIPARSLFDEGARATRCVQDAVSQLQSELHRTVHRRMRASRSTLALVCQIVQRMEVKFLPVHVPSTAEKEDATLYANNMQRLLASHLGIGISDATYGDYVKVERAYKAAKAAAINRARRERRREEKWWNPLTSCLVCLPGISDPHSIRIDLDKFDFDAPTESAARRSTKPDGAVPATSES